MTYQTQTRGSLNPAIQPGPNSMKQSETEEPITIHCSDEGVVKGEIAWFRVCNKRTEPYELLACPRWKLTFHTYLSLLPF